MRRPAMHAALGCVVAVCVVAAACTREPEPPDLSPDTDQTVRGHIVPFKPGITVEFYRTGEALGEADVDAESATFTFTFRGAPPDEVRVRHPSAAYPFVLSEIPVVPPLVMELELPQDFYTGRERAEPGPHTQGDADTVSLSGWISTPDATMELSGAGTTHTAMISATGAGAEYALESVPAGEYTLELSGPAHVPDSFPVAITADTPAPPVYVIDTQARAIEGVDVERRVIRATGMGKINPAHKGQPNAGPMARRAAMADGYRNLLARALNVPLGGGRTLGNEAEDTNPRRGRFEQRIQGVVQGAQIVDERTEPDGTVILTLEMPLTGARGINGLGWPQP